MIGIVVGVRSVTDLSKTPKGMVFVVMPANRHIIEHTKSTLRAIGSN